MEHINNNIEQNRFQTQVFSYFSFDRLFGRPHELQTHYESFSVADSCNRMSN